MFFGCCGCNQYFWLRKYIDSQSATVVKQVDAPSSLSAIENYYGRPTRMWPTAVAIQETQSKIHVFWIRNTYTGGFVTYDYDLNVIRTITFTPTLQAQNYPRLHYAGHTNGSIYALGYLDSSGYNKVQVKDSNDAIKWSFTFPVNEQFHGIQVDSSSNVYCTTYEPSSGIFVPNKGFTYKFNSAGAVQWKQPGPPGWGRPFMASDDNIYQWRNVPATTFPASPQYYGIERWTPSGTYASNAPFSPAPTRMVTDKQARFWMLYGALMSTTATISQFTTTLTTSVSWTFTNPYLPLIVEIDCVNDDKTLFMATQGRDKFFKYNSQTGELMWTWSSTGGGNPFYQTEPWGPLWRTNKCSTYAGGYIFLAGERAY